MNLKYKRIRKILITARLTLCGDGYKKAAFFEEEKNIR